MRRALLVTLLSLASCDERTVTVTNDPFVRVSVHTNKRLEFGDTCVSVEVASDSPRFVLVPVPIPYEKRPIPAERPPMETDR